MVMTRTANTPVTFGSDGIRRYDAGVANVVQERIIVETANVPVTFTNSRGITEYTQYGTGSAGQQAFSSN